MRQTTLMKSIFLAVASIGLLGSPSLAGDQIAGVGARPLSDAVAVTWFIREAKPPDVYDVGALVFLRDEPGWTQQKTGFKFTTATPIFSEFTFENGSIRVEYSQKPEAVSVAGMTIPTSSANVLVVQPVTSGDPKVVYQERLSLEGDSSDEILRSVLSGSRELRLSLGVE